MSSTHTCLLFHLVFATKNREPRRDAAWRSNLHDYLGGIIRGLEGTPQGIGGMADHVHLLVALKATHRLADVMREVKKASSAWIHDTLGQTDFHWQEGYAAFSVSASVRESVQTYIASQDDHHRTRTFREELVFFLGKSGIAYDPRYLD
jgi:REP element-mobilizing transposase RayT